VIHSREHKQKTYGLPILRRRRISLRLKPLLHLSDVQRNLKFDSKYTKKSISNKMNFQRFGIFIITNIHFEGSTAFTA
jgi:hypothetical protein